MQSRLRFFKQWVKNPREIGSITPSSRFLTREVVQPIVDRGARLVVELGPGTGVFTQALLDALPGRRPVTGDRHQRRIRRALRRGVLRPTPDTASRLGRGH